MEEERVAAASGEAAMNTEATATGTDRALRIRPAEHHDHTEGPNIENAASADTAPPSKRRKKHKHRDFDLDRYHERHVALRIAYLGMAYHGFASQGPDDEGSTVEAVLLRALQKACLIKDRTSSAYSRCGRTDKGVSAFGQVISINLRTHLTAEAGAGEVGFIRKESALESEVQRKLTETPKPEIDYVHLTNRLLPDDIKVTAWSPVPVEFDARFSASSRSYKYFFLREDNDIERMRAAAKLFIGEHDFRNFCKMDIAGGVTNYRRKILSISIEPADPVTDPDPQFGMYCIDVCGHAFVWHQIRCMAAVLFMVGRGDEDPEIVTALLDVEKHPCKPQYGMASDLPLVLYDCKFPNLVWRHGAVSLARISSVLHTHWRQSALTGAVVKSMLRGLREAEIPSTQPGAAPDSTEQWTGELAYERRRHIPLLERATSDTLEVKLETRRLKEAAKAAALEARPVAAEDINPT